MVLQGVPLTSFLAFRIYIRNALERIARLGCGGSQFTFGFGRTLAQEDANGPVKPRIDTYLPFDHLWNGIENDDG